MDSVGQRDVQERGGDMRSEDVVVHPSKAVRIAGAHPRANNGGRLWFSCAVRSVLCATVTLLLSAQSASAVILHLSEGRRVSYSPIPGTPPQGPRGLDEFFSNLDYNGGPILTSNTNYALYWDPPGGPKYPADFQAGINQYFEDIAHDSGGHETVDSVATQYNNAAGEFANYNSHFGGALVDTDPYPTNGCSNAPICLTDRQIRAELTKYTKAHQLPRDLAHEYFVLTPPGVEFCLAKNVCSVNTSTPTFCAWHSIVPEAEGIVYAADPYDAETRCEDGNHPNGRTSDGVIEGALTHEHIESITDPIVGSAWEDVGNSGSEEIGDKCRNPHARPGPSEKDEYGTPLGTA